MKREEVIEAVAKDLLESDAMTPGRNDPESDSTPDFYYVEADNVEYLVGVVLTAVNNVGVLALEQEWGVKHSQGLRSEPSRKSAEAWAEMSNARNAHRYDYEGRHKAVPKVRNVTPWRDAR